MIKVKTFIHILTNSAIPKGKYYSKLVKTSFDFSLKYFFVLIIVLSFIASILTIITLSASVGSIKDTVRNLNTSLSSYPDDLIIKVKNGKLSTNYQKPYIFWYRNNRQMTPIFVIDQYADYFKIDTYDAPIIITSNGFAIQDKSQINITKFNPNLNLTIDNNDVIQLNRVVSFVRQYLPFILAILIFLVTLLTVFFTAIFKMIYILIISFVIFVISHKTISNLKFKKTLQITIHSSTLPLTLEYLLPSLGLFSINGLWIFFVYLVFSLVAIIEIHSIKKNKQK